MKIGIITFHNAINYGAVLQCYALQEVIRSMGHEVEVVDYRNDYIENRRYRNALNRRLIVRNLLTMRFSAFAEQISIQKAGKRKAKLFSDFRKRFLCISKNQYFKDSLYDYDICIIGSDQMWSFACTDGYDNVYFGEFKRPQGSRLASYAISSSCDFSNKLKKEKVAELISSFDYLSFREQKVCDVVKTITGRDSIITLDPTLLAESKLWAPIINDEWKKKEYVALYQVRYPREDKFIIERKGREYAKAHNLDFINITDGGYSVQDFISIIKNAKCVFTSSFHATVFSIIFKTPLVSFLLHDGFDERYENLLKALGEDQCIHELLEDNIIPEDFDSKKLDNALANLKQSSLNYITQILS